MITNGWNRGTGGSVTAVMRPLGPRGVLTLVIVVAAVGQPFRVVEISNARWGERPPRAKNHFDIIVHKIKKPFHLISGFRDSVPQPERYRLKALASADNPPDKIRDALVSINVTAARNGRGYVSEGCWVASQVTDGQLLRRSVTRNVGEHAGSIPLLHGGFDFSDWIKKNYRAAPGKEIRLVQTAGVVVAPCGATPMPSPYGDPRSFTLSGSSAASSRIEG